MPTAFFTPSAAKRNGGRRPAHFANQNPVDNPETDMMVNSMGILTVLQNVIQGA